MFAHHGTPQRVDSDNGPPFNSEEFAQFAQHEGFTHLRITPEHPRANREAERFIQTINKTEQIAHLQGKRATERES
jgi:transposase InsO family protein